MPGINDGLLGPSYTYSVTIFTRYLPTLSDYFQNYFYLCLLEHGYGYPTHLCTYQSLSAFHKDHKHTDLSSTSSSSLCRSQAMYSRAMSVIRGHQDKSRLRSLRRFSATSSTPSSVILEQPERLRAVKLGRLCTMLTTPWLVISQQE